MEKEKLTTFDQMKRVATELYLHFSKGVPSKQSPLKIGDSSYDGSASVDMTEAVNSLVDDKLDSLVVAEEVSF